MCQTYLLGGVERVIKLFFFSTLLMKLRHIGPLQNPIRPNNIWVKKHLGYIRPFKQPIRNFQVLSETYFELSDPYLTHHTRILPIITLHDPSDPKIDNPYITHSLDPS